MCPLWIGLATTGFAFTLTEQHKIALDKWGIDAKKAEQWVDKNNEQQELAIQFLTAITEGDQSLANLFIDSHLLPSQIISMAENLEIDQSRVQKMIEILGDKVAKEQKKRSAGWKDFQATLIVSAKAGKPDKQVRVRSLEGVDDGDMSLSVIESPAHMRNTAMLTKVNFNKPDDQWVYLPKSKRVKKITLANRNSAFMGSEFTFNDLSIFDVRKYDIAFESEQPCNDTICFKIILTPKETESLVHKMVALVDIKSLAPVQVDYYYDQDKPRKTLIMKDYQHYDNAFWRPNTMIMKNHESGASSKISWKNLRFDTGLKEKDFTQAALKRAGQ